jgi:hypothetical protein
LTRLNKGLGANKASFGPKQTNTRNQKKITPNQNTHWHIQLFNAQATLAYFKQFFTHWQLHRERLLIHVIITVSLKNSV